MRYRFRFHSTLAIVLAQFVVTPVVAATREPLTIGYSNVTATYAPVWIAVEEHIGAKYGLDLKAIYAGRVRPQQFSRPVMCRSWWPRAQAR